MKRISHWFCLLLAVSFAAVAWAESPSVFPSGVTGEFVSLDLKTGKYFRVNPSGCAKQFPPYSSFKIPNSLIGLETGVIKNAEEKWHWDAEKYPGNNWVSGERKRIWEQDLELRRALEHSIVWYYRELATRVGQKRMKEWLKTFDYGNQDISAGLNQFWLGNSLRISPDEQVQFLTKLQRGDFPVSKKNLDVVKEILTRETTPGYRWIGKTGSSAEGEGWLVGWVEAKDSGCSYALHLTASSYDEMAKARPAIAKELLKKAGCLK